MTIKRLMSEHRYSGIVIHNNVAYFAAVASQKGGGTFREQSADVLRRVDEKLAAAGSDKSRLIAVTVYMTDIRKIGEFNEIWDAWVSPGNAPSRHAMEAKPPILAHEVELFCIAAVD